MKSHARLLPSLRVASCCSCVLMLAAWGATAAGQTTPSELETRSFGGIAVAEAERGASGSLDSVLAQPLRAARDARMAGAPEWVSAAGLDPAQVQGNGVLVDIAFDPAFASRLIEEARQLGVRIDRTQPHRLEGLLPWALLEDVAGLPGVRRVMPQLPAKLLAGASQTQGVVDGRVDRWHSAGIDGTGVTIAVIDSFSDVPQVGLLQGTGDWPPNVQLTLVDMHGGGFGAFASNHGMATMEIVYDVAPGASYIAYDTRLVGQWRDAIYDAVNVRGADVISVSLGAPLDGIGDGSARPGSVAEAVAYARANGVLVVNAAGNGRESHWGGLWASSGIDPDGNGPYVDSHDFEAGLDINCLGPAGSDQCYCFPAGVPIQLEAFWDDWSAVDRDYDLRLLRRRTAGPWAVFATSSFQQAGGAGESPQEFISTTTAAGPAFAYCGNNRTMFAVQVVTSDQNVPNGGNNLQIFSSWPLRLNVPARSLGFPADSASLVSVAAIDAGSVSHEPYSSEGPVLAAGGGLPQGGEPHKPDIASFANVDTESYGAGVFNGTSSATPHVAGVAALLIDRYGGPGSVSVDFLHAALLEIAGSGSNDLGAPGPDFMHGAGRLRLQAESGLSFEDQPSDVAVDAVVSPAPSVSLRDDEGELVFHGLVDWVGVDFADDPSGGTAAISGGSAALQDGLAVFGAFSVDTPGEDYALVAQATTLKGEILGSSDSAPFDVIDPVVASVAFTKQPANGVAGQVLNPNVTVEVRNASGQVITIDDSTEITLTIESNPSGGVLAGTTAAIVSGGFVDFDELSIDAAGQGYTLRATAAGGASAVSEPFDIVAGPAAQVRFLVQPSDVQAGAVMTPEVVVRVEDEFGNGVVDGLEVQIGLSSNPGGDTLGGPTSGATTSGQVAFTDLSLDVAAAGYALIASHDGLQVVSEPFDVLPAEPAVLSFSVQPSDIGAGEVMAPRVEVLVQDAFGNAVADGTQVGVALAANPGGDALAGDLQAATVDGVGDFADLSLVVAASGYTLEATAGVASAMSEGFDVLPQGAATVTFVVQPSNVRAGEIMAPAVEVGVQDAFGNFVADGTLVALDLEDNPGSDAITGSFALPTVDGVAVFADLSFRVAASGYSLRAESSGPTTVSGAFDVLHGPPARLRFAVQPSDVEVGASIEPAVEVQVEDAFGNVATSDDGSVVELSLSVNPGLSVMEGGQAVAVEAGVARFANLQLDSVASGYQLQAQSEGLEPDQSLSFDVLALSGPRPDGIFKDGFEVQGF